MFPVRTVHKVKICETKKYPIISEPEGDFLHTFKVELQMPDEPVDALIADILAAAEGKWIYRPVRVAFHINPYGEQANDTPVEGFLHIHSRFKGIKRKYLFLALSNFPPQIEEDMFEGDYKVRFYFRYHEILFATLPGDKILINMYKKSHFEVNWKFYFAPLLPRSNLFFSNRQ